MILYFWFVSIFVTSFPTCGTAPEMDQHRRQLFSFSLIGESASNKGQNLLCKGNDNAACKGQKAVCPLGRVVGF